MLLTICIRLRSLRMGGWGGLAPRVTHLGQKLSVGVSEFSTSFQKETIFQLPCRSSEVLGLLHQFRPSVPWSPLTGSWRSCLFFGQPLAPLSRCSGMAGKLFLCADIWGGNDKWQKMNCYFWSISFWVSAIFAVMQLNRWWWQQLQVWPCSSFALYLGYLHLSLGAHISLALLCRGYDGIIVVDDDDGSGGDGSSKFALDGLL